MTEIHILQLTTLTLIGGSYTLVLTKRVLCAVIYRISIPNYKKIMI